jgi:hypothetical protein
MLNDMMLQNQRYFISKSYVFVCYDYGPLKETAGFIQGNVLPQMNQVTQKLKYYLEQLCRLLEFRSMTE